MKNKKVDIDKVFSSKLKDFEMDVPDAVWDNLSARLSQENRIIPQKRFPTRKVLLWGAGIAASILLLLFLTPHESGHLSLNKPNAQLRVQQTNSTLKPSGNTKQHLLVRSSSTVSQKKLAHSSSIILKKDQLQSENTHAELKDNISEETQVEEVIPKEEKQIGEAVKEKPDFKELERKTNEFSNSSVDMVDRILAADDGRLKKSSSKHNLALVIGSGTGLVSHKASANQVLTLGTYKRQLMNSESSPVMASTSESVYQLEHSWPISFILGVSKPLTSYLSLEVGISYSYLYSKQKGRSEAVMAQTQQFSYIGLPIALNFRVATWGKWRVGVLVGGSIQKDIAGQLKQRVNEVSSYESNSNESIHQKYIQPSLNSNLHLSYSLVKNLNVYGKFGGAYYFNMRDNYSTIYSDKNFLPDVGFGLSYNFDH